MEVTAECSIVPWLAGWSLGTEKTAASIPGVLLEEGAHRTDLPISEYCFSYRIVILL